MFFICIVIAVCASIYYLVSQSYWYGLDGGDIAVAFIGIPIMGCILGFIFSLFPFVLIAEELPQEPLDEPVEVIELVAMKDGNEFSGSFFLGSGGIGEEQYYYYLTDSPKGIQQKKIQVTNNVYLKYIAENETPRLESQTVRCSNDAIYFLSSGLGSIIEYTFYIPKGSITTNFAVDLE